MRFLAIVICLGWASVWGACEKVICVTGTESSGSKYIARVISEAVLDKRTKRAWGGRGFVGYTDGKVVVAHHSQPTLRPAVFRTAEQLKTFLPDGPLYFVVPIRDRNIVALSKKRRFNKDNRWGDESAHEKMSREILSDIVLNERAMIWSYETFVYFGDTYLQQLYAFLEVETPYFPKDVKDGNTKYINKN